MSGTVCARHVRASRTIFAFGLALPLAMATTAWADTPLPPPFIKGEILHQAYDGVSNDLLSAGLGAAGLQGAAPAVSNPPTAAELRRLAIYNNYRALIDVVAGGGFGTLYGPGVAIFPGGSSDQLIAGDEFLAFAGDSSGKINVTLMVQVPESFDPEAPCIVTGPSSGSRGVYGAIGTSGEWGLKRGCAVAYTDKGTGTGAHDLQNDMVHQITGERVAADTAGTDSIFTANVGDDVLAAFNAATPNRFAFKHAHSRQNPEKDWGTFVLQSVEFAFYILNAEVRPARFPEAAEFTPQNTLVIASSVSNGGGASVRAAEQDTGGLIDAIVVSEPNVNPVPDRRFAIVQGSGTPLVDHSRSLHDYVTLLHVYQGCAGVGLAAPLNLGSSAARCASLKAKGLLTAATTADQALEAQAIINDYGFLPEQNIVQPSHWFLYVPQAVSVLYSNAYSRARVTDNLCGYSYGATTTAASGGNPIALPAASANVLFSTSSGIPQTGGVNIIANQCANGQKLDVVCQSPSTATADQNLDGALCLRSLAVGTMADGSPILGEPLGARRRATMGVSRIRATGNLGGRPALFVTGRSDAILPPNHTSRAYYGLSQLVEGANGGLRYYEVTNAQHLDVLNGIAGFNDKFIPLHYYFIQALNLMYEHLTDGAALPPSQVVHTVPRGAGAPPITLANLPDIAAAPGADAITFGFDGGLGAFKLGIPD